MRRIVTLLLVLGLTQVLHARPAYKQALTQVFGSALPKKLHDCSLCHLPGGDENEKPHNLFGKHLAGLRKSLRKMDQPDSIEARLEYALELDSDSDKVTNLLEILTGHNPGDLSDVPSAEEIKHGQTLAMQWRTAKKSYAWRPFDRVQRPKVPQVKNAGWVRNPLDAFIAAEHEALGLKPRPEAAKEVLLRRVTLDLIGLTPTPAELHAFVEDTSPQAYENVVARLLEDPRHGERWARHWMDVWRYSDWAGFGAQIRDSQPHIWRWRDWIVDSLNADKAYDRMVLEMLAGDELAPEDPQALIATGYLVRNWKLLSREKWLQDTVEHTSQAFLGLTLQCAKCHDHMYDPITQAEYYQLRAVFEPHGVRIDRIPGQPDTKLDGIARVYDKDLAPVTYLFTRGDDRTPDKNRKIVPTALEALGGSLALEAVTLPKSAYEPDGRAFVLEDDERLLEQDVLKARAAVEKFRTEKAGVDILAQAELDAELAQAKHDAFAKVRSADLKPSETKLAESAHLAQRQVAFLEAKKRRLVLETERKKLTDAVKLAANEKLLAEATKTFAKLEMGLQAPATTAYAKRVPLKYPTTSTGRRLALARWIVSSQNPLAARVAVNHVWLRHFGTGIVPTPADFGRNGRAPSHPALLDWLAAEFMDGGWKMRDLHRLIVTSATYRQASTSDAANLPLDRDNKYLWRYPSRRLEAETVRDLVFHVAGQLDSKRGGPEIDFMQGLATPRRSLYFRNAAEKQMEFLSIFDGPSVTECYLRKPSVIPQQALAMLNSELTMTNTKKLTDRLAPKFVSDESFVRAAFEEILARSPGEAEVQECVRFLTEQKQLSRARLNLVHALFNLHEFVTIR